MTSSWSLGNFVTPQVTAGGSEKGKALKGPSERPMRMNS